MSRNQAMALILAIVLALLLPSPCVGKSSGHAKKPLIWSFQPIAGGSGTGNEIRPFNDPLMFPLPANVTGAESLAFDRWGHGPYAGVSDGRVLRWNGRIVGWTTFAYNANYKKIADCTSSPVRTNVTEPLCGRPLGLQFHAKTGYLYIADAYLGLMRVGPRGGKAEVLATKADDGKPFHFVNGLDVDQATGDVYFTDSSLNFQRMNNVEILYHREATGRLLKYDARTKKVAVLQANLPYPNGVALSGDRTHIVVAHTGPCQAFRYWLTGKNAEKYELLADLPGFADNVRRDSRGGYWFGLNMEKLQYDTSGRVVLADPDAKHLVGVRIDGNGAAIEEMTAPEGVRLSEVAEKDGKLWLGSVDLDHVGFVDLALS